MRKFSLLILLLSFINCAFEEPYFMTIVASSDSNKVVIDNHYAEISDIHLFILLKTKDLDSIQKSKFFIKLKVEKEATMGVIADIKNELRKANVLNIKYYVVEPKPKRY